MNTTEAVAVLRAHNEWRRAEAPEIPDGIPDAPMPHSACDIGIAIDVLCDEHERLREGLRKIACQRLSYEMSADDYADADFQEGYNSCIQTAREVWLGNPHDYRLNSAGEPICRACGESTNSAYLRTPNLICWNCGKQLATCEETQP